MNLQSHVPSIESQVPLTFTFTIGLTGSGKSKINEMIESENKKLNSQKTTFLLLDDYITSNGNYKKNVNGINRTLKKTANWYNKFHNAYMKSKDYGCIENPYNLPNPNLQTNRANLKTAKNTLLKTQKGCSKKFDTEFFRALKDNENIVYESIGRSFDSISWVFPILPPNYTIKLVFLLFNDLDVLKERIDSRGNANLKVYEDNKTKPAPRYPDSSLPNLKASLSNLLSTLKEALVYPYRGTQKIQIQIYENSPTSSEPSMLYYSYSYSNKPLGDTIKRYETLTRRQMIL